MKEHFKQHINLFIDEVYQYVLWEYGELMHNQLKCESHLDIEQNITMYYLGGNNIPYTAGELVRIWRKHHKEEYNKYGK